MTTTQCHTTITQCHMTITVSHDHHMISTLLTRSLLFGEMVCCTGCRRRRSSEDPWSAVRYGGFAAHLNKTEPGVRHGLLCCQPLCGIHHQQLSDLRTTRDLVAWVHKPRLPTGLGMQPQPALPLPHQVLCLIRDLVPLWADKLVPPLHDSSQHDKLLAVPERGKSH